MISTGVFQGFSLFFCLRQTSGSPSSPLSSALTETQRSWTKSSPAWGASSVSPSMGRSLTLSVCMLGTVFGILLNFWVHPVRLNSQLHAVVPQYISARHKTWDCWSVAQAFQSQLCQFSITILRHKLPSSIYQYVYEHDFFCQNRKLHIIGLLRAWGCWKCLLFRWNQNVFI